MVMPRRYHQTESLEELNKELAEAKRNPLSEWVPCGKRIVQLVGSDETVRDARAATCDLVACYEPEVRELGSPAQFWLFASEVLLPQKFLLVSSFRVETVSLFIPADFSCEFSGLISRLFLVDCKMGGSSRSPELVRSERSPDP
jgi:hypothetical protein